MLNLLQEILCKHFNIYFRVDSREYILLNAAKIIPSRWQIAKLWHFLWHYVFMVQICTIGTVRVKVLTLVFKCRHGNAPAYLSELIKGLSHIHGSHPGSSRILIRDDPCYHRHHPCRHRMKASGVNRHHPCRHREGIRRHPACPEEKLNLPNFSSRSYTDEKWSLSLLVGAVYLRVATVYIRQSPYSHRIHPGVSV